MNPNSSNQRWSKWVWFVVPGRSVARSWKGVQANIARFGRKAFGSSSEMRIREQIRNREQCYLVEVLTEGHPVHDPQYVQFMRENWQRFFVMGFGVDTKSKLTAKLMAGSRQDGKPADQLLIMPIIDLRALALG